MPAVQLEEPGETSTPPHPTGPHREEVWPGGSNLQLRRDVLRPKASARWRARIERTSPLRGVCARRAKHRRAGSLLLPWTGAQYRKSPDASPGIVETRSRLRPGGPEV